MAAFLRRSPFPALGIAAVAALLLFAYEYLDRVARQEVMDPLVPLIEQGTGVLGACLMFFVVRRLVRRVPLDRRGWLPALGVHLAALVGLSALHTTFNWGSRELIFRLAGLGDYDYGVMAIRYFMELPIDVILYASFVGGVSIHDRWDAERRRALAAMQLESLLAQARLSNLQLQLQPHFLFNALNTISSVMYQDPAAADTMIARLAELLRYALQTARTQEVALSDELDALGHYLALLEARFGDDFVCRQEIDPSVRRVAVPSLILQPLIENAVRHGSLARIGRGTVVVRARPSGPALCLEVEDDGPGRTDGSGATAGVGLHATSERLRLLYGDAQAFTAANVEGGFRVSISMPRRTLAARTHVVPGFDPDDGHTAPLPRPRVHAADTTNAGAATASVPDAR